MTREDIFPLRIWKKQKRAILMNNGRTLSVMSNSKDANFLLKALNKVGGTMYIVEYSTGYMDDFAWNTVFVTYDLETAKKYVRKFNRLFKKWKGYAVKKVQNMDDDNWMFWYKISEINKATYSKIEIR